MGIISGLFSQELQEAQRAIIDAMALSIVSDHHADPAEIEEGVGFVVGLTELPTEQARALLAHSFERLAKSSVDDFIAALVQHLPSQEAREAALFAAAFVQYVDGKITEAEDIMLVKLAHALELDEGIVATIIQEVELQLEEAYGVEGEDA